MSDDGCGFDDRRLEQYRRDGFIVHRRCFSPSEMLVLQQESERLLRDCADLIHPRNLRCRYMPHHESGEPLFEVFDPVNDLSPVCQQFCDDRRILDVVEAIYGEPACLFKDKLIFKPPGATGYRLHQDIPLAWKAFPQSFVTVLIPIDALSTENGCTEVFAGYHSEHLSKNPSEYMLPDELVDETRRVNLELEPGDIAVFHGLTPHRSAPNRSSGMRRTLYVSYNAMSEGGDQRAAHHDEFQIKMRQRLEAQSSEPVFFK